MPDYKRLCLRTILLPIILLIAAAHADIRVCPDGCDYSSIQEAIGDAKSDEEIRVESATYCESVSTAKEVILHGLDVGGGPPVLRGSLTVAAEGAVLKGFEITSTSEDSGNGCLLNMVGGMVYLNNFPGSKIICPESSGLWNSSQIINYEFESRVLRSRMGNYWADYHGKDENLDGIGDEPKVIDPRNVDYYPLMQPRENYHIEGEKEERTDMIKARVGKPFTITLRSNPTTGYKWFVDYDYYLLSLEHEDFEKSAYDTLGAEGASTFVFMPLKPGKTTITTVYRRPWENIVADVRTFNIEIEAEDSE